MTKSVSVLLSLLILGFVTVRGQVKFDEIKTASDWETAVNKALSENKLIFLDIYATWCGPCKMLDRDVYPDTALGNYYNSNFINLKMDGETEFGRTKVAQYSLRAYPTMYYMNAGEVMIGQVMGVKQAPDLVKFGRLVNENSGKLLEYNNSFGAGEMTAGEMLEYSTLLLSFGLEGKAATVDSQIVPSLSEQDILNPAFREFIIGSPGDIDGKVFMVMAKNINLVDSLWSPQEKDQLFSGIYDASMGRAITTSSVEYRDRIINEFLPVFFSASPENLPRAEYLTLKIYDANTGNWEDFEKRILDQYEKNFKGDDKFLYAESYEIVNNYNQSEDALATADRLIGIAVSVNPGFDNLVMQAYLAGIRAEFDRAREVFTKIEALELNDQQLNILNELKSIVEQSEADKNQ